MNNHNVFYTKIFMFVFSLWFILGAVRGILLACGYMEPFNFNNTSIGCIFLIEWPLILQGLLICAGWCVVGIGTGLATVLFIALLDEALSSTTSCRDMLTNFWNDLLKFFNKPV